MTACKQISERSSEKLFSNLEELFVQDYEFNLFSIQVLKNLQEKTLKHKSISLAECFEKDNRLYY